MDDPVSAAYIASLPDVETARLPQHALFWANNRIYQVTETGAGGFRKAREWRAPDGTDVALVPGSFASRFLPLISRGKPLPVYGSRQDLTHNGHPLCFVFPTETLALDAAALDVDLISSGSAYVRPHGDDPAFIVTDGVHHFRLYYYRRSSSGRKTNLSRLEVRPLPFVLKSHIDGPGYWRLLPSWVEGPDERDATQQMKRIAPESLTDDDTLRPLSPIEPPTAHDDDRSR